MSSTINGYNPVFQSFVQFAQSNIEAGNKKAIANLTVQTSPLSGRKMVAINASRTDSVYGALFRSNSEMVCNDITRELFLKSVIRMFGGESKLPAPVLDALNLQDFCVGKPLTARRIMAVKEAIDSHLSAVPDTLDVIIEGKTVTFEKWHYEQMVAAMPESERPRGLAGRDQLADQLKTLLTARITNGLAVLRDVCAGNGNLHKATMQNVADLTLALHTLGLRNGEKLPDGSFSVADPDGRLAKWLDTSADVYLRSSSHLKAYQGMRVDGHTNMLRGIDIPEGKNGLMAGKRTVHYGTIPDLSHLEDADGCGPKRRLFLKCETHGVFYNTACREAPQTAALSQGMRPRVARDGDWKESLLHMFSFIETRGADPTKGGARKEHMTQSVKNAYKKAVADLKAAGRKDLANILASRNVEKGGAMLLFDNLSKTIAADPNCTLLNTIVADLLKAAQKDAAGLHGDVRSRLGNEIMIDARDIV